MGTRAWALSEGLRLELSRDFLATAVPNPAPTRTPVDEKRPDRVIRGNAYSTSRLELELGDCDDCVSLTARLDVSTSTRTTTDTRPREDIKVSVFATGSTETRATKQLVLRPEGIEAFPMEATSRTALTLHGVSASAKGPFPGEKRKEAERIGQQAFFQSRARNEELINERVAEGLREKLEGEALSTSLRQLNHSYRAIFYEPVFLKAPIKRELHLSSRAEGMTARVDSELPATASPPPAFGKGNLVSFRVHESFLTGLLAPDLAGRHFDEADLEEYLILHGVNAGLGKYKPGEAQIHFDFCRERPLTVSFQPLRMQFSHCLDALELHGKRASHVTINVAYVSRIVTGGRLESWRLDDPELVGADALTDEDQAEIVRRLSRIFPEQLAMPKLELMSGMSGLDKLAIHRADLGGGWLVMEMWLDPTKR